MSNLALDNSDKILVMRDICKDYVMGSETLHVLKNVDLSVKRGQFLAILGPSGSGKSTLMNIIGCLDVPTSGEYELSGRVIADEDETSLANIRNKEIGFVFQSFYLLQRQTAFENVELPLIYAGMPEKRRRERVEEVLEKVGLADKMYNLPNQLSGGQQQRVAIARAVSTNPTILLADEPTSMIDACSRATILDMLLKLRDEINMTIVFITHDIGLAYYVSDTIYIMEHGKFVEVGKADDVILNPQAAYTKRLISDVPKIHEEWDLSTV